MASSARLIAYYLPQFHPIPENDEWWGKGFTEWTNVVNAKPLFPGHDQPNLPSELGFYDLRVPETRMAQAELAREHGIEGFCYWHYWFGDGRRLLERPFNEVLNSGEPDFPFCLAWANQTWTGVWHGAADRILIEQAYPGLADYRAHFYAVLDALSDRRYMTIEDKPIFLIYRPDELPDQRAFTDCWRELAHQAGFKGLYLIGVRYGPWNPQENGFDAAAPTHVLRAFAASEIPEVRRMMRVKAALLAGNPRLVRWRAWRKPRRIAYERAVELCTQPLANDFLEFPTVHPNWDNTPRSGMEGVVFMDSTPEKFGRHLREVIGQVAHRNHDQRIVFLKSWNEWAEGNYLEPDQRFGRAYLQMVKQVADGLHA